jgi:hypothetical protein
MSGVELREDYQKRFTQLCTCDPRGEKLQEKMMLIATFCEQRFV